MMNIEGSKGSIDLAAIRFPKIWPGLIFGILTVLVYFAGPFLALAGGKSGYSQSVTFLLLVQLVQFVIWLTGIIYWCVCVYKLHKILLVMTDRHYPISPGRAVGFGFIPFFNWYWDFKWPAA